jgi:DMSO/TMAO reductase YedYZ heme-binding membrane subunit
MAATSQAMSSGRGALSGHLTVEEMGKSWPLIGLLVIVILFSGVPAYYLSGWWSVIVSWIFSGISAYVGYYALTKILRQVKAF